MNFDPYLVSPPIVDYGQASPQYPPTSAFDSSFSSLSSAGDDFSFDHPVSSWANGAGDYQQNLGGDGGGFGMEQPQQRRFDDRGNADQQTQPQQSTFNPLDHARLSPSAFNPSLFTPSFVLPRFSRGPRSEFEEGPAVVEPSAIANLNLGGGSDKGDSFFAPSPSPFYQSSAHQPVAGLMGPPPVPAPRVVRPSNVTRLPNTLPSPTPSPSPPLETSPVYDLYGSSVVSINPSAARKLAPPPLSVQSNLPTGPGAPFDPEALGLPIPPNKEQGNTNWKGLYSSSGFDMLGVLARVIARPNPQINIGPVDSACSFLVVDARKFDFPIVFASETFTALTGYTNKEIVGKNCRFLQSPDGVVVPGEKRKYTDSNAAHHLKRHIVAGKESQTSMINYFKGGRPFINLITVVPITWDSDEIAYYVGFQVDLVDQPSAILEKMKNGTYCVNYSLVTASIVQNPTVNSEDMWKPVAAPAETTMAIQPAEPMMVDVDVSMTAEHLDVLSELGDNGKGQLTNEPSRKQLNRMLLDNCDDFVHVLSLKGSLLYVSPSVKRLLEYEPHELIGKGLSAICHPSDIVSVLRELKDSTSTTTVNLVYRIRRKNSGYMWMEASGKLHIEQGKGRKSVILIGRPREVYKMSWHDLERVGGFGKREYWSKLSAQGMFLHATPSVQDVLGYSVEEIVGTSLLQLAPESAVADTIRTLQQSNDTTPMSLRHKIATRNGFVDVVTNFFSSRDTDSSSTHFAILAQTNLYESEMAKRPIAPFPSFPRRGSTSSHSSGRDSPVAFALRTESPSGSDQESTGSAASFSAIPSTFKTLADPSTLSDNLFDELDTTRGTSWQFELHQLRLTNKKLREEKHMLAALQRKKRKHQQGRSVQQAPSSGAHTCANCGRADSPEWRSGPTGPKTLCNACGLRWSKGSSGPGSRSRSNSSREGSQSSHNSPRLQPFRPAAQ